MYKLDFLSARPGDESETGFHLLRTHNHDNPQKFQSGRTQDFQQHVLAVRFDIRPGRSCELRTRSTSPLPSGGAPRAFYCLLTWPACKAALQKELGFAVRPGVPLLGFIGRLDQQKGIDIIAESMPWLMTQDVQLVMLGTGRKDYEALLRNFEGSHRDKVRGWVGFSVKMAHRITAGVDILLMPSRFEPCGLNQLYAMRYGTVPVVHAVGGLKDTVQSFNPFNETGLGWTFEKLQADAFIHALGNAMWTFHDFKNSWKGIQQRGMAQDLSWDHAAQQYEEVLLAAKYTW